MAVEQKRGCGYRKAGGIYLVTDGLGEPCERLPMEIPPCPLSGDKCLKQGRAFAWLKPKFIFDHAKACAFNPNHCPRCVVCQPVNLERHAEPKDSVGLMWVGEKFYGKPEDWTFEAMKMGVSKRIPAVPKNFVVGKTFVFVAHPRAFPKVIPAGTKDSEGLLLQHDQVEHVPGVFHVFRPSRVEVVVTPEMKTQKWVKDLQKKHGAALVEVPGDDPDHAPPVKKKSARARSMERAAKKAGKAKSDTPKRGRRRRVS